MATQGPGWVRQVWEAFGGCRTLGEVQDRLKVPSPDAWNRSELDPAAGS